ncbi:MAG TPA: hypothetical protein VMR62_04355 [Bryobacteraceae bacterium]|jgi:hypothetical protein|nr:hypothetical protein [Bryobacteraceae bacterium]
MVSVDAAAGKEVTDTARISAAGYDSAASNTFKVKTKVTNLLFSYYNLAESSQCERVLESGL